MLTSSSDRTSLTPRPDQSVDKPSLYISDAVHLELWIAELKHASALMNFHFRNGDQRVVVEAQQKGIFIDRDSQRPRRLPAEERQLFSHYTLP